MKKNFDVVNTLCLYMNEHQVCVSTLLLFPSVCKTSQAHLFVKWGKRGVLLPCVPSPCSRLCCLMSSRLS